ncbi:hypothetical protein PG994_009383 [Apiospora phragmitis]|uniref:Uncharacterized protein n=1 Tax=Apiospora phragmitis TaxID=2905665 RepID=A0ABR1UJ44_9PEZI
MSILAALAEAQVVVSKSVRSASRAVLAELRVGEDDLDTVAVVRSTALYGGESLLTKLTELYKPTASGTTPLMFSEWSGNGSSRSATTLD